MMELKCGRCGKLSNYNNAFVCSHCFGSRERAMELNSEYRERVRRLALRMAILYREDKESPMAGYWKEELRKIEYIDANEKAKAKG